MLSISKPIKAGQGEYYLSLASTDDYYFTGEEPPGHWLGRGAAALGLEGQLAREEFRHLLRGLSADGNRKLVRNVDVERRAGWDLTWSAPKSVSVAWSQAPLAVRDRIEQCMKQAVVVALEYLEAVGGVSRRGEDGKIHERARLVFAAFPHSTSRAMDPQLHVHTILLNVGVRPDGTTGTLEPRELYRHQMTAGALFRAELASALESELGLRARREGRAFELMGVDLELVAFFSKRRAQIEAELARLGWAGAKASEIATFATRARKENRPRQALFDEWQTFGRQHNWSTKELAWLLHASHPERFTAVERDAAATEALKKLTTQDSHFCRRQLLQAVAESCQGRGLGAVIAQQLTETLLLRHDLVQLGAFRGEVHYTTQEILMLERRVVAQAEAMWASRRHVEGVDPLLVEAGVRHPKLSEQQVTALEHVCRTRGGVALVHGMAGTGKSTLFAVAKEVWEQQGLVPIGAAPSGKAAQGLAEATGIPSTTLHRLISQIARRRIHLGPETVVVLDESAMIGTRSLAQIVAYCHDARASLVLCGDTRQLQAVEMGGVFGELTARLPTVRLNEIRRQREEWARQSVHDFAFGRAERALQRYQDRGLVAVEPQPMSAVDRLLADWRREAPRDICRTVILAGTAVDTSELNRQAQAIRWENGCLGRTAARLGAEQYLQGDRILFTRNSPTLGVWNGDLGIIRGVRGDVLAITLDDGREVKVSLTQYPHVRLGYALTTHKAQGMTVENSYVLTGGTMTHRELTYVQASRARGITRWYVGHDRDETTRQMARSHEKLAALALAQGTELELKLVR